jgi:hypothetical protein
MRGRHWVTHFRIDLNSSSRIMVFPWLAWILGISVGPISTSVLPCKEFFIPNNYLETVKIVSTWKRMDPRDPGHLKDREMEENDFEDRHRLFIRVCALSSTVSYALDTLVQHHTLIGQLQDEVYALRSQNEDLQRRLDQREETKVHLSSSSSTRIVSEASIAPIPDLNEPVVKDWNKQGISGLQNEIGS